MDTQGIAVISHSTEWHIDDRSRADIHLSTGEVEGPGLARVAQADVCVSIIGVSRGRNKEAQGACPLNGHALQQGLFTRARGGNCRRPLGRFSLHC